MQIKIFTVPVGDDGTAQEEMNRFLRGHKILEVQQHFRDHPTGASWCFCVHYLLGGNNRPSKEKGRRSQKIDYKEVLSEKKFRIFSQLREIRKKIAREEGLPAFAVFTDAELAEITKLPEISSSSLEKIKGIGEKKAKRFGEPIIAALQKKIGEEE